LFFILGVCLITVNMVVNAHSPGTASTATVPILVTWELLATIVSLRSSLTILLFLIEFFSPQRYTFILIIHIRRSFSYVNIRKLA